MERGAPTTGVDQRPPVYLYLHHTIINGDCLAAGQWALLGSLLRKGRSVALVHLS
jgi:hypothetical protein